MSNLVIQTLNSLRSTHGDFQDRPLSDVDLKTILDTCIQAANASNKQSYSIIVVEDRERMKELTPYVGSVALIFCVDFNRLQATASRLAGLTTGNSKTRSSSCSPAIGCICIPTACQRRWMKN